ncbi:acetate and sugar kinases/Hsc70/actin family protein [Helicobacter labacensis]|uniref:molecular chaperone DnaK n=1 Tax=Helicobacter labacensis TaxID=2316079 RepID=UPI000EB4B9BB|nr:molecular chaperone DnaK [Helicobacter labacensis]
MEHTKTINGIHIPKEQLEARMNASWEEFSNNENLSSPEHSFTKHIIACCVLFKQSAEKEDLIPLNDRIFYLPKEKFFAFVYQQKHDDKNFKPNPTHALAIEHAGKAYHELKLTKEQIHNVLNMVFDKLPLKQAGDNTIGNNITCKQPYLNEKDGQSYLAGLGHRGVATLVDWTLDLVPTPQSFKEVFTFLYPCLTLLQMGIQLPCLRDSTDHAILRNFEYDLYRKKWILRAFNIPPVAESFSGDFILADRTRAGIQEYDSKMLTDPNRGLWELWGEQGGVFVLFKTPAVARNPKADIKNGLVGIDFGTASTAVVYQEESASIHLMRIAPSNVSEGHYENPTSICFEDLTRFLQSYRAQKGRPKTRWDDVNTAHVAQSSKGNPTGYLNGLKQWAGNKHQKFQITDKQKTHFEVKGALDLRGDDLNPIEIYAYYLGLYINNQYHGIYLNYLLSFPVTYEQEVRQMILESFKRGLAKSLPNSLHAQGVADRLKVEEGASEPAAYAIMALEGYGFEPSAEERVYYGVFDFGGGTTDFDFGLFKEAPQASRYDYILEHFGAGGDRYLGGEHLLELASLEVIKYNKDKLLQQHIPFKKPAEGKPFSGSEILLSESQEARANTQKLVELLRPLWEGREFEGKEESTFSFSGYNRDGGPAVASLDFDSKKILALFKERIKRGVENFFGEFVHATNAYFNSRGDSARDIDSFHIFSAGNASKSAFVTELFKEKITQIKAEMEQEGLQEIEFIVHQPLGGEDLEKPNGKTGVAFGLIKARRGGSIQVIDYNVEENIKFKYFLGRSKKRKFYTLVARNQPYNQWVQFLDASESHFEVYYTSHASASTNTLSLEDSAIKKKALETGMVSDRAFIFVRLVSPSEFEFVVATQEGLESGEYLTEINKVKL